MLKSECNILDRQNHSAEALWRALAIDAVIAWRIMLLALFGREVPELPSDAVFDRHECRVWKLLSKKTGPTLSRGEAITIIAQLGGTSAASAMGGRDVKPYRKVMPAFLTWLRSSDSKRLPIRKTDETYATTFLWAKRSS